MEAWIRFPLRFFNRFSQETTCSCRPPHEVARLVMSQRTILRSSVGRLCWRFYEDRISKDHLIRVEFECNL
jgi:hypothetical protein